MPTLAEVYEDRAEDYTRAAERTDDPVFRNILLMLALQWRLAGQQEASKGSKICGPLKRPARSPSLFAAGLHKGGTTSTSGDD
jgi:hypothetical protein